jgi:hypothetical protein
MHGQVGHVTVFLTIISCILCLHLLIAKFTEYVVVQLLFDLMKRIGESEGVIMSCNHDDAWKSSTFAMNQ